MDHTDDEYTLDPNYPCEEGGGDEGDEGDEDNEELEPGKLLDEYWFYSNLLDRNPRMMMPRSLSDPCTSLSKSSQENFSGKSYEEPHGLIQKLVPAEHGESRRHNFIPACSLIPPRVERKQMMMETQEDQDEEIEFSMGKLIRQASMNNPDTVTERAVKGVTANSSISRTMPELGSLNLERLRLQRVKNSCMELESLSNLQSLQLQSSFQNLGFNTNAKYSEANVMSMVPRLQEEERIENHDRDSNPRGLHGEQSRALTIPKWAENRWTEDPMKAQIKFWARAVASHQMLVRNAN